MTCVRRRQRHNTLQVAILGQLQKPPAGFEEAVRWVGRRRACLCSTYVCEAGSVNRVETDLLGGEGLACNVWLQGSSLVCAGG